MKIHKIFPQFTHEKKKKGKENLCALHFIITDYKDKYGVKCLITITLKLYRTFSGTKIQK